MPAARKPQAKRAARRTLTVKQELFVEAYLGAARGNATEAAVLAGYSAPNRNAAHMQAVEVLKSPTVRKAIAARLQDAKAAMGADEVLERLTEQARMSIDDFLTGDKLDFDKARRLGRMHLVKSITPNRYGLKLELVDGQAALFKLGSYHKLFTEKHEVTGADGAPLQAQIIRMPAKETPEEWSKRNK